MAAKFTYDEVLFKPLQREAAIAMVEYDFTPKKERRTKQGISDDLGITRKTLHNWERKDANFIAYRNYLASEYMNSHLAFVYQKLLGSIENGSVRGIETYLKRIGDLDTNSEVTVHTKGTEQSFDERKQELLERLGKLDEGDDDNTKGG